MKISEVVKLSPFDRFCYWIKERESIRLKKEAGEPKPWTDDEILQKYRFTCPRRMDDKVSQWLLNNWYQPYFDHPNMLPAIALARFINLPSSLEIVGFPEKWNRGVIKRRLYKAKKLNGTVFNAAYMVRGNDGPDKIVSVVDHNVNSLYRNPVRVNPSSMEQTWQNVVARYGMGSFMAGQVVADLRWAISGTWTDRNQWAPMGPGSLKGINYIHGRPPKQSMNQDLFLSELIDLRDKCLEVLPSHITRRLELMDFQNCLCETSKYSKALFNEGRPKQLYAGV